MSIPDTTAPVRRGKAPLVRRAAPADYVTIRAAVNAAYGQYASLIPPGMFSRYLADLLDLDRHASHGPLLVVEADGQVRGFAAFYPEASSQRFGWPAGWASGRALAVDPATRGHGIARTMAAACERLAHDGGSPVLAFHTASFMTSAIALYERLGYRRALEFDLDMAAHYRSPSAVPITALAYLRYLRQVPAHVDDVRHARCTAAPVQLKQRHHQ